MPSHGQPLSRRKLVVWRVAQTAVWFAGLAIVVLLIVSPDVGLAALWNVLIPLAPAILVFFPGLWRNICPLATTALAARHFNLSARRTIPDRIRVWLNLLGVFALFAIVLWRRFELNTNGAMTAIVLVVMATLSVILGMIFEWKSGWCSGLCPVHGVEKLYGSKPLHSFDNAHCDVCHRCSSPCPDSTAAMHSMLGPSWAPQVVAEWLVVGAFPGFVWGWFHVPDWTRPGPLSWHAFASGSFPVFAGMTLTLAVFLAMRLFVAKRYELFLVRAFAAGAVSCYYWYRVPALVGYGHFPSDGVLIDLTGVLPDGWVVVSRILTTSLFVWWLVFHQAPRRHWSHRPRFSPSLLNPHWSIEAESSTQDETRFDNGTVSSLVTLRIGDTERCDSSIQLRP